MDSIIADLRYAGRELRRRPGFALTAVISLALGIGATSTVFSVVYGIVRVDREQQVMRVRDLEGWITNLPEYAQQKLVARLFGIFSMLALALSAVGLYRVVSYGVATRTNEFGIRMALGASARDVVRLVLSGTGWTIGAGLLAGMTLCLIFDNVTSRWVTETSRDPAIVAAVTSLLLAVAALACLAPARRAASIDPMEAVRHE